METIERPSRRSRPTFCCFKHRRRVARDNTVKYYSHTLQLLPSQQRRSYAGTVVVVLCQRRRRNDPVSPMVI